MRNGSKNASKLLRIMLIVPNAGLIFVGIIYGCFSLESEEPSLVTLAVLLMATGSLGLLVSPWIYRRFQSYASTLCKFAIALSAFIFSLGSLELASTFYWRLSWRGTSFWLLEDYSTQLFDPIRGTFLSDVPARTARITNGIVEYVGIVRGNAQGFADRDHFSVKPQADSGKRIVVLGDSFTAGFHGYPNWPDRVEDLLGGKQVVELLNFGVNGAGLGNWWSVLMRFVEPGKYEVDGMIFAVYDDDLDRRFSAIATGRNLGLVEAVSVNWQPISFSNVDEARNVTWRRTSAAVVSPVEFDRALLGTWPRQLPRPRVTPILFSRLARAVDELRSDTEAAGPSPKWTGFDSEQRRLIQDLAEFVKSKSLPTLVIFIPSRMQLLGADQFYTQRLLEVKTFAEILNAVFCDSTPVFQSTNQDEVRSYFFPYDGHWNANGSERFAQFMLEVLKGRACPAWSEAMRGFNVERRDPTSR